MPILRSGHRTSNIGAWSVRSQRNAIKRHTVDTERAKAVMRLFRRLVKNGMLCGNEIPTGFSRQLQNARDDEQEAALISTEQAVELIKEIPVCAAKSRMQAALMLAIFDTWNLRSANLDVPGHFACYLCRMFDAPPMRKAFTTRQQRVAAATWAQERRSDAFRNIAFVGYD